MPYAVALTYAPPSTGGRVPYLQVSWTDSTDVNAASNNIYRGTTHGGPYTKIANVQQGTQVWADRSVSVGVVYYYVLTEVDNQGNESGFSVEQSGMT